MIELDVEGMSCGHCVAAVTRAAQALDPQADVDVDLRGKHVRVRSDAAPAAIAAAITDAGYPARVAAAATPPRVEAGPQPTRGCCGGGCACNKASPTER